MSNRAIWVGLPWIKIETLAVSTSFCDLGCRGFDSLSFRGQVHYDLSKFFTLSQEPIRFFVTKLESALNVESSQLKSQVRFFCCFSRFSKQSAFFWQIRLSQVIFLKNATRSDKSLIFFPNFFLKHNNIQTNFQFMFNIF